MSTDNTELETGLGVEDDITEDSIEIIDDTPEEDRGRTPLPPAEPAEEKDELEDIDMGVKKRINQLTHRYHDERRAREALERQNQEAVRIAQAILAENQQLKGTLTWGQQEYLNEFKGKVEFAEKLAEDQIGRAHV